MKQDDFAYTNENPVYLLHIEFGDTHYPLFSVHKTQEAAETALRDRALDDLSVDWGASRPTLSDLIERWANNGVLARIHSCTGWGSTERELVSDPSETEQ